MNEQLRENLTVAPDGRPDSMQPAWRRDFPIDRPQDAYVMRRDFTKFMVLTSLAFTVGQFWIVVQNWIRKRLGMPARQEIARLSQLPVGGAMTFHYAQHADVCLLMRTNEKTLIAYNQKCTHLSCAVVPEMKTSDFPPLKGGIEGGSVAGASQPPLPPLLNGGETQFTGRIRCPCHNGYFDLASGRPLSGPPRRPLPKITLEVIDDVIYATGVEVRTI